MQNYKSGNGKAHENGGKRAPFEKNPEEKDFYSAGEVEELVAKKVEEAIKTAKAGWDKDYESKIAAERDDAARLASMSAEERARAELNKRESAFEEEKKRYMGERMEFEATKLLAGENLPVSMAKLLAGADESETEANVDMFRTEFDRALEQALNERLRGRTPRTASVTESADPFLAGFGM